MEEADQLADEVALLDHGRIIAEGTPAELKARLGETTVELHLPDVFLAVIGDAATRDRPAEARGAEAIAFGAMGIAIGLAGDQQAGNLTRFPTLPMARSAIVVGRTGADLARNLVVVLLMTGAGFAVGFRMQAFATQQPVTATVSAARALSPGGPTAAHVATAVTWIAGLLVAFVALATARVRRTAP